jgi:arabinoxylan arabinofuranohydrolase
MALKRLIKLAFICFLMAECNFYVAAQKPKKVIANSYSAYLFAYFTGNAKKEEAIRFAISSDGYHYKALNNNEPIILSEKISATGGVRDPHIIRGVDGKTFYMVATDMVSALGWNSNRAMVLLKSTDLINWSSSIINIQKRFAGNEDLQRVWAPQTIYDAKAKKYMIYWSMKHGDKPDIIYYAYANTDFTDLESEPKQLFYHPQNTSCIDGDIMYANGKYHLFFKTEGSGNGIKQAVSDNLTEGYKIEVDKYLQQTKDAVEGAGTFKLNNKNEWILMYDMYTSGKYQFTKTTDFLNFKAIDKEVTMDFHPRHGTVMPITSAEAKTLVEKWLTPKAVLETAHGEGIRKINTLVDTANRTIELSVLPNANLKSIAIAFDNYPGVTVKPSGSQNFSNGAVNYAITIGGKTTVYKAKASQPHNPVLAGFYADPDILYAEKTGKFYIYPTSDGFNGWSGTYFKTFSSADLVNWKDEGKIIELGKDVTWANRNAWAPCIVEKKINGEYKYFYYFTAAQKIGVAVADNPTGPFKDLGKPLIDQRPQGARGGQQIDPDVFTDPKTGKSYLYWGNGYMAGVELNDDMVSIKQETLTLLKPDRTFREGTHVLYRNGIYYFLWSEDDTRSENYKVRYATSNSPLGAFTIPANNIVIAKNKAAGIYATGHNSTIQIPGKDEWYIIYHRFNYPKGITQGDIAGFNREVCIDKLAFDAEGNIKQTIPTHEGIAPVNLFKK